MQAGARSPKNAIQLKTDTEKSHWICRVTFNKVRAGHEMPEGVHSVRFRISQNDAANVIVVPRVAVTRGLGRLKRKKELNR